MYGFYFYFNCSRREGNHLDNQRVAASNFGGKKEKGAKISVVSQTYQDICCLVQVCILGYTRTGNRWGRLYTSH